MTENCENCDENCNHSDPFANFDDDTKMAIQEIQILEQNFEQLMQQKHLFNMEINETTLALGEVEKSEGDLFKVVGGQVMIKTSKEKMIIDLTKKKELLKTRMKNIEEQEKEFSEKIEELRQKIMSKISSNRE